LVIKPVFKNSPEFSEIFYFNNEWNLEDMGPLSDEKTNFHVRDFAEDSNIIMHRFNAPGRIDSFYSPITREYSDLPIEWENYHEEVSLAVIVF
jgi:hypothetical protein